MINLKLAFRTLLRTPFITLVVVVSLALGVGATSAIFSLFHQFLLRPLPVPEPGRLVILSAPGPKPGSTSCNQSGSCEHVFSFAMFRDLERSQTVFTGIAAFRGSGANIAYGGQTVNGEELLVSGSYFSVLGVQPAIGRLIGSGDDRGPGESPVVVLSHAFWLDRFAGNPGVLNENMIVNGVSMTIIGVTAAGFDGTTISLKPHVFVPITMREPVNPWSGAFEDRRTYWAYLFARLKPGVSIEQARASLNAQYHGIINDVEAPLQKGISDQTMARFRARPVVVDAGARGHFEGEAEAKPSLVLLLGLTGFVLLIACANVANLLLARAIARGGEMSVRAALGAARRHLVAQLITESFMLAAFGGVGGILVARWTLALIASLLPRQVVDLIQVQLDPSVLAFSAVLTIGTGLLFGLFPAIHGTRPDIVSALKGQAGQPSGTRAAARFRQSLATTQIALATMLLVSAGLFMKSLAKVSRVDLGLRSENVITFGISPSLNGYKPERSRELFERLEGELAALLGVNSASGSLVPLIASSNWGNNVSVEGFQAEPDTDTHASYNEVGPDFFRTMGIPLVAGREFTPSDAANRPKVAIVNEAFARKFNLGRDVIGKHIGNRGEPLDTEIVGFVQDAKYSEVKRVAPPQFFRPYRQGRNTGFLNFYIRTAHDPEQMLNSIPRVVARLDPNLPVEHLGTLPQQIHENMFFDRFITVLSTAFACLATVLAGIGLYGVLAYTVTQRTREIGLRIALGAAPTRVQSMILRQVGMMAIVGSAFGLFAAGWLGRLAESMLYEMRGRDPVVLAAAAAALMIVALGAGFLPAYRASRIDPMRALRYD